MNILYEDKSSNLGISKNAALVVEKLYRNGKWGFSSERFEFIQEITHLSADDLEESIEEIN